MSLLLLPSPPLAPYLLMPGDPTQTPPPLCSQLQPLQTDVALSPVPPRVVLGNPYNIELLNSKQN